MNCMIKECEPPYGGKENCEFNQNGECSVPVLIDKTPMKIGDKCFYVCPVKPFSVVEDVVDDIVWSTKHREYTLIGKQYGNAVMPEATAVLKQHRFILEDKAVNWLYRHQDEDDPVVNGQLGDPPRCHCAGILCFNGLYGAVIRMKSDAELEALLNETKRRKK